jgi:hypothetical protein
MLYDVFICHASEDKDDFVRPLAARLQESHLEVWYDEFALSVGDSVRRAIDRGLTQSRYGIVVLSPSFFAKNWTQYELDGLVERETAGSDRLILPIWYQVSHADVLGYSPSLANRKAARASDGLAAVAAELLNVMRPQGSPLIIARDTILRYGATPPVITDEFWLDVVEASNRVPAYGPMVPDESSWGRWSFPLPDAEGGPAARGERLAWAALQLAWTQEADRIPISVTTEPDVVLDFIDSQPGLREICELVPSLTIEYAPQLTIPGFGGYLEPTLEEAYQRDLARSKGTSVTSPQSGSGIAIDGKSPRCEEEWSLRHPAFGGYESGTVADAYFHGGIFGPDVAFHEDADHLFWLLSDRSKWLPAAIRETLLDGLCRCTARWPWQERSRGHQFKWPGAGSAQEALWQFRTREKFAWTKDVIADWRGRINVAREALDLPETTEELLTRVRDAGVVDRWKAEDATLASNRARRNRKTVT